MNKLLPVTLFLITLVGYAQGAQGPQEPIKITGTVLDQETDQPLEYATLVLQNVRNPDKVTGGITDANGKFEVETAPGNYNVSVEYISYKSYKLENQNLRSSKDLGVIRLALDVSQLAEVEVVGERTTVELRLDKKVYNVGSDLTVKGGSVTDVLSNVPSVSVDVEGNISLRGNESVRILINGKPSALSGLSPEALQQLPADAIEKVEVITNPSARYDAEGTAGILNIILKQSKTAGVNGSVNVYTGHPETYGGSLSLNLRRDNFNIFTNTTYRYRSGPGNALFDQENFDSNGNTLSYQNEIRDYQRKDKSFNTNVGFELFFSETSSITNSLVFSKSNGDNTVNVDFSNFDANRTPTIQRNRFTVEDEFEEEVQYSLNYQKKFEKEGHTLTFDYQYSKGVDDENSIIEEVILGDNIALDTERTIDNQTQVSQLVQMDYVLPFGKDDQSQFELGYRGTFNNNNTDFDFGIQQQNGDFTSDPNFSNELNYKEYVNAAYTQLGTKFNKFSILGGLRMEASDIGIELVNTNELTNKDYVNWFPSIFLGYEFSEKEQVTLSYSKRLRRPWSRFINPFPSRSSNTNLFQGNPDLDPTFTDSYDLGYLKRWDKFTFTTSGYFNRSTGVFQFVSRETGDFVTIENPDDPQNPIVVPVQVRSPINLATEERMGMEFTTTYTPKRNWRLTWNLNAFQRDLKGDFTYINSQDEEIVQNFDANNFSWFTRFSAKIPLPGKIDFQTNFFYMGPSEDAQNTNKGMLSSDLGLSKDILKDKGSLTLNVGDIFNSRKRITDTRTENVATYSEFQWRQRQITLSFQYRFNQPQNKNDRNRQGRNGGGEDMDFEG
ncbi:outer membrane beta-barrel family protein [Arenibacter algicola]|uniref:Vitamin B12 transporter BtuB n=1 Tax=Arenibacter algicola TaxID=616991 RepID=A0A221V2W1_9FLAO|nr:outer membrane beta-barrel family protein [Arenibacter algicola]ASO07929.1 vitamin B12 transporter BtuB [Arenibacter algicola]|tara:strand:- start:829 stop:3339 length:2511 start_codon:yes stop_codon:yes gene_type:complete